MNVLQAAGVALKEAGTPLHYKEITQRMIDRGLWQPDGKTPHATVSATITGDIKQNGAHLSPFRQIRNGASSPACKDGGFRARIFCNKQ